MNKPLHPIAFVGILWTAIFSWSKLSSSDGDTQIAESAAAAACHIVDSQPEAESPPEAEETPL